MRIDVSAKLEQIAKTHEMPKDISWKVPWDSLNNSDLITASTESLSDSWKRDALVWLAQTQWATPEELQMLKNMPWKDISKLYSEYTKSTQQAFLVWVFIPSIISFAWGYLAWTAWVKWVEKYDNYQDGKKTELAKKAANDMIASQIWYWKEIPQDLSKQVTDILKTNPKDPQAQQKALEVIKNYMESNWE